MPVNLNLYDIFRRKQVAGTTGVLALASVTVKMAIVTNAYSPNQNTHDFFDDVTNEVTGTNYTAGGPTLSTPTVTMDAAGLVTFDAADPATWTQHASGFSNGRRVIIYRSTGTASTSELIAYSDANAVDFGNTAADLTIVLDAAGIFTAPR